MTRNRLYKLLGIEALVCVLLSLIGWRFAGVFSSWIAFPFEQIGMGLRAMSLSGSLGNIFAVVIYFLICLLPLGYLAYKVFKDKSGPGDFLLVLVSALLLTVMYFMVNPWMIGVHFGAYELENMGKALMGGTIYSVLAGYVIFKIMRRISASDTGAVLRWLRVAFMAICALLVILIFGQEFSGLLDLFTKFQAGNTDSGSHEMSYIFMTLQYIISVLPAVFELGIIFKGLALLDALREDSYSDEVVIAANRLGAFCMSAVIAIMASQIAVNVLQIIAGSAARVSNITINIPFDSVVVVLIAFLAAQYFQKGKEIKDDLDSFV